MSTLFQTGTSLKLFVAGLLLMASATVARAQDNAVCMMLSLNDPPAVIVGKAKPFSLLMNDAMIVMNYGMGIAPMTGDPDHDFAAMMIPHHRGAIDMARLELQYGKNPALRRLAQEVIATEEAEIALLRREMQKLPATSSSQSRGK
ncbi:MAG TPA: DUF305 domain-containing protein [Gallionella sp.]|nr:DUF305 domain-containing protein [Gallionella sp.]